MPTQKMYVLVRNDLSDEYKFVQGAHSLADYAIKLPNKFKEWNNSTIVFLGVRNLIDLRQMEGTLSMKGISFTSFKEPDLDNQVTALACYCDGKIFNELKVA